jgi:hypothetical protein
MHDLGGARNAQRIMKELDDYVSSFRDGENVFYLNKQGRQLTGCRKVSTKTNQAKHYIMRNDVYIAFECPKDWRTEMKLGVPGEVSIVCDALFKKDERFHIVEVDHTQKMSVNKAKIQKYKRMVELGVFDKPPVFIWMTTTNFRREILSQLCEGLETIIFTVGDFH